MPKFTAGSAEPGFKPRPPGLSLCTRPWALLLPERVTQAAGYRTGAEKVEAERPTMSRRHFTRNFSFRVLLQGLV